MLKVLKVGSEANAPRARAPAAVGGSMLDEVVRDCARQMLAAALQAEVAEPPNHVEIAKRCLLSVGSVT